MAPTHITEDYYAILEISPIADLTSIKSSFRRLAKTKHPDKNSSDPNATAEFQLLHEAYSTIKDPETRRRYDIQYTSIKHAQQTKPKTTTTETPQQQSSSGNRNTEKKGAEKKQRAALREVKLQELNSRRARQNSEVFAEKIVLDRLQGELNKLQEDSDNEAREQAAKRSWWGYVSSFLNRGAHETDEEKAERERRQLDRRAAQTIKEKQFERQKTKVRNLETGLQGIDGGISRIRLEILEEQREDEGVRQREAQKKQEEAEEKWKAKQEDIRRECEIRMAEERRCAAEAEEQRRRRQAEVEEEKKRKRREEQKSREAQTKTRFQSASCDHKVWWDRVEGGHLCSHCSTVTRWYAFQCRACNKVACASCRHVLKETSPSQSGSRNFRKKHDGYKSTYSGPAVEDYDAFWDYLD